MFFSADLKNTDLNNESFLKKIRRAHEALSHSDGSGTSSIKTLSASFGTKWPYKRTMSAPASMIPRHEIKGGFLLLYASTITVAHLTTYFFLF